MHITAPPSTGIPAAGTITAAMLAAGLIATDDALPSPDDVTIPSTATLADYVAAHQGTSILTSQGDTLTVTVAAGPDIAPTGVATASSSVPGNGPETVIDGDDTTSWVSSNGEGGPWPQDWTLTFARPTALYSVRLLWIPQNPYGGEPVAPSWILRGANGGGYTDILADNTGDGTIGGGSSDVTWPVGGTPYTSYRVSILNTIGGAHGRYGHLAAFQARQALLTLVRTPYVGDGHVYGGVGGLPGDLGPLPGGGSATFVGSTKWGGD